MKPMVQVAPLIEPDVQQIHPPTELSEVDAGRLVTLESQDLHDLVNGLIHFFKVCARLDALSGQFVDWLHHSKK
jgi:hypothetical protein